MSISLDINTRRGGFNLSLNCKLPEQGITAIYGPSGCGKTTLLRCLAGLQPNNGAISINGTKLHLLPTQKRELGYVFQEDRLFPHLTVTGNLQFAWQRRFNDNGPTIAQVTNWLELDHLLAHKPPQLSGGQKKRVSIGRALLSSPRCLLLDEPLAGLDQAASHRIIDYLKKLRNELAIPILFVSHQLDEITRIAEHLLILEKGKLVATGPLLEILARLDLTISQQQEAAVILQGTISQRDQQHGLSAFVIGANNQLWISDQEGEPGENIRVRIPARDVSIALQRPEQTSILNILPATITEVKCLNHARALIKARVIDTDQVILARITQKSLDQLALTEGMKIYLQIKTVALLADRNSNPA